MSRWLEAYTRWIVAHRRFVVAAVALATMLLLAAAGRLHVEVDADRQLPQDHPYIRALNDLYRLFGDKNLIVVGLFPHDGNVFTPTFLRKLAEITDRFRHLPGANPALIQSLAAPQTKDIRGTADGITVVRVMEAPPVDIEGAEEVRRRAFANPAYVGTLVAQDGSAASVQASFELTPQVPGYREIHRQVLHVLQDVDDGTFDFRLSGPVAFMSELSTYSSRMAYLFPLALLVIGLIHYHAFGTLQALFLPLLTALLSVLWALGVMGIVGVPLDPINTTTPILILAIAAGHAVQILKRFYEEYDRAGSVNEAIVGSLARIGPVMLAAGTVAGLSFCSLAAFRTATIRTFGLFTGFGIFSAMIIELTMIPAVRAMLPAPRVRERQREAAAHPWMDAFLRAAARLARDRGRLVFVATGLLVLGCINLASRLQVEMSLKRQFGAADPVRRDDAALNAKFAGTNTLILLVEGDGEGALEEPAVMRAILGLERRLEQEPGVGKATSYVDFVRRIHLAMNADRPDAGELPATRALTAQYLFLYSLSGGGEDFDTLIDPTRRAAKVRLLVHEDDTAYGQRLIDLAQALVAQGFPRGYRVRYTGSLASTTAGLESMVSDKLRNIFQITLITLLISSLLLRSVTGGLLVVLPLVITVGVNFGVMGALGIPLDTVTAALSAMAVGIGADYAMYLLFRIREEVTEGGTLEDAVGRALMTSGKAVLFVSSAVAFGYATLCLSGFRMHVELGSLVALAMVVSSASTLLLLPAIVLRFRPAFLWAVAARRVAGAPAVDVEGWAPPVGPAAGLEETARQLGS
ncbi:MAG TPA: MMPL family transporter [Candidatus Binatia bacterium]|nr:MMPL family transporter [Candidatus Binatia bacterium]